MRRILLALGTAAVAGVLVCPATAQEPTAWKVGVGAAKITPQTSIAMAGYAGRKKPSEGVATDLWAKALAIEDPRGSRLVIVTMDLISVPRPLRDWLSDLAQKRYRLPPNGLLMNCSHTHCGPSLRTAPPTEKRDAKKPLSPPEQYMVLLKQRLETVVGDALKRLAPAKLDFLHARAGFAMNRRRATLQGYRNAPNFEGPVDHEVPVLRVTDAQDKIVALLFGYACHNTTMGDYMIRGDYAGYAQQYIEEAHPGTTALFMIGCGADQNPYPRSTEELAKYHGRSLALAVEAALQTVPRPLSGPLRVAFEDVMIDYAPPLQGAQSKTTGQVRANYPCPVQVVRFGRDLTLVAIGGETVVDYSLRLKRELAGPIVWVAGYSNDVFTYLPSSRVLAEGGYEAGGASGRPFAPSTEERVVSKALALARTPIESAPAAVDLKVGQQAAVRLSDGKMATVKLLKLEEKRDSLRNAIRQAEVTVEVAGHQVTLDTATYHLPVTVGDVQIDCPITKGYNEWGDHWGLEVDARLRVWPAGYPWITPGTFCYPVNQRWFASHTLMANQIGDGDDIRKKSIYYHWGLDIGGAERMVDVLAATDGVVVSADNKLLEPGKYPELVKPRADVLYLRDDRGWYYRYSHLDSTDPAAKLGVRVKMGQKIAVLGKKGASGGWSHLHFDIVAPQPSGRWGILEGYALLFEAYHNAHPDEVLEAVARPHLLTAVGQPVTLDGSRSWSRRGPDHITAYSWTFSDGKTARGPTVERRYAKPGTYSEILRVADKDGNVDFDFAEVRVVDPKQPNEEPPRVHAAYWPTHLMKAGDEITFKARTFSVAADEGEEEWDFGDRTPKVRTRSDGNAQAQNPEGYAVTKHRYAAAGQYLVQVSRTNRRGETGTARLEIIVRAR